MTNEQAQIIADAISEGFEKLAEKMEAQETLAQNLNPLAIDPLSQLAEALERIAQAMESK